MEYLGINIAILVIGFWICQGLKKIQEALEFMIQEMRLARAEK